MIGSARLVCFLFVLAATPAQGEPSPEGQHSPQGQVARPTGRIVGVVVGETGQPVVGAAVVVRASSDSTVVAEVLTEAEGRFRVEGIPFGRYTVRVSHLGYAIHTTTEVTLSGAVPVLDLGTITLKLAPLALDAVEARAERAPVVLEADRTVYNAKQMAAAASNALDVLRAVPELEVDANNQVTLRGGQAVAIHLGGRPTPLKGDALTNFLRQMPGNRIARVEVMPNPSAKHDPEGTGGIVNLVLEESLDLGFSGSASLNATSRGSRSVGGRINYQRGRVTLFTGGSFNTSDYDYDNYDLRKNLLTQPVTFIEQEGSAVQDGSFRLFDLTAELRIGKQGTLWAAVWENGSGTASDMLTAYGILDEAGKPRDRYDRVTDGQYDYVTSDYTLGFKQKFAPQGHELTVDARRARYRNDIESRLLKLSMMAAGATVEIPPELTEQDVSSANRDRWLQADYTRPWGAKGKLDAGIRISERAQTEGNLLEVFETEAAQTPLESTRTAYRYDERFRSAYASVSQTFGRVGVQLGLRTELAATTFAVGRTGAHFENDYLSLFPSANLSYDLGQGRTLRFSYSKRIARPQPYILNPDVPSADPLNFNVGNPEIRPNYTHSLGLDLSWIGQKGTVRLVPYYRSTVDAWDRVRTVDAAGVSTMTWANVAAVQALGTSLTASLRPTGRLGGSATLSAFRENRDASNLASEYSRSAYRWSASANGILKVTNSLTAQTNVRYSPPWQLLQGNVSGMFYSSLGLRQQLWGTKGSVNLFINDPFDLYNYRFETRDRTHEQSSRTSLRMRTAVLGFTYNFGKPPEQNSRRTATEEAPETVRIR